MKFSVDIDCTPEEARAFLGLPDVSEFQKDMMAKVQAQLAEHVERMDPEALMKAWMPVGAQAMETFQKAFMQGFAPQGTGKSKE